jgi:hypothetical protein
MRTSMPNQKLTDKIIVAAAIQGFEAEKARIAARIAELRTMLVGGPAEAAAKPEALKRKRKLSQAGREAIAAALRKRWQEKRRHEAEQETRQAEAKAKRIAALTKARKALAASRKAAAGKVAATPRAAVERVTVKEAAKTTKKKATRAKTPTPRAKKAPANKQTANAAAPAPAGNAALPQSKGVHPAPPISLAVTPNSVSSALTLGDAPHRSLPSDQGLATNRDGLFAPAPGHQDVVELGLTVEQ